MTDKKLGPGMVEVDGKKHVGDTFEFRGVRYTMRELTQNEIDEAFEANTGPDGKITNGRLLNRMQLAKSLVSPATSVDDLGDLSGTVYGVILRHFNDLHTLPVENPTVPAGSAGQTSPDGGSESPTT